MATTSAEEFVGDEIVVIVVCSLGLGLRLVASCLVTVCPRQSLGEEF